MVLMACTRDLGNGTYTDCAELLALSQQFVAAVASSDISSPFAVIAGIASNAWTWASLAAMVIGAMQLRKTMSKHGLSANLERIRDTDRRLGKVGKRVARYKSNIAKLTREELLVLKTADSFVSVEGMEETYTNCVNACELLEYTLTSRQQNNKWFCTGQNLEDIQEYLANVDDLDKRATIASGLLSKRLLVQEEAKLDVGGVHAVTYGDIARAMDWSHEVSV